MFGTALSALVVSTGVLGSPRVEHAAIIRAEVLAGSAPLLPHEPPEAAVAAEAQPGYAMRLSSSRWVLTLKVRQRIYYRAPNPHDFQRPLLLGAAEETFEYQLSKRAVWNTTAGAAYGEVDYGSQQIVFGPGARQVDQPVVRVLTLSGESSVDWQVTRRYRFGVLGSVLRTDPVGQSAQSFPRTTDLAVELRSRYELSERSSMELTVAPGYVLVDGESGYIDFVVTGGYRRDLTRRTELALSAGAAVSKPTGEPLSVAPVAIAQVSHLSYQRRGFTVTNRFLASVDAPLDPTTGQALPSGTVQFAASGEIGEHWFVTAAGTGVTAVTPQPLGEGIAETYLHGEGSVGYSLAEGLAVSVGARYIARGTHVAAPEFHLFDRELWGFVSFTAAFDLSGAGHPSTWAR